MISAKNPREVLTESDAERVQEEKLRVTRSIAARHGRQTRRDRDEQHALTRPLGGTNTPSAADSVCDESLLRGDPVCPARILDLCGGCAEGTTREQVGAALAAGPSPREWVQAAFGQVTQRMINAAERADERYDQALDAFSGRHQVNIDPKRQHQRRIGSVLNAAHQVKDKPELPNPGHGPRVHAYTPATASGPVRHLLGNITPTRHAQLTEKGATLTAQDPQAPTDQVPASARRLLAAAHTAGLSWDLTTTQEMTRLTVRGLSEAGDRDVWTWRNGRLDRDRTYGRPLREALATLTNNT